MLSYDGLILIDYRALPIEDKDKYDNLARELVALRLIIKNCTSSRARTYLEENYFMDAKNSPSTIVTTIALIISFGASSGRTSGGGGEKDTNKLDGIVSLHLADDSNNNLDDDDELVESFESDDSNDEMTNSDNMSTSIADGPVTTSELQTDITDGVVTGNDDDNDDNNVNNDASDGTSDDGSSGDASDSDDKSTSSTTNPIYFFNN